MTIQSETSKVVYIGDGITNEFPVPFYFFANQISVYQNLSDTPLEEGTDYTIINPEGLNRGIVEFINIPDVGDTITITRNVELKQLITFLEGENFPAIDFEHALDKLTMGLQQLQECMSRAVVVPHNSDLKREDVCQCLAMLNQYWDIVLALPEYISTITNSSTEVVEENNPKLISSGAVYDYAYDKASVNAKIDTLARKVLDTEISISPDTVSSSSESQDYPFCYQLPISGVNENTCPVVMFNQSDALSGEFAPFAKAYNGGIELYVKKNTEYTTTIPLILLL